MKEYILNIFSSCKSRNKGRALLFFLLIIINPNANYLYSQDHAKTEFKNKIVKTTRNREYITKYRRQWMKEREFMLYLNLTRILTLHQPLIGIGTFKLNKGAVSHSSDMARRNKFGHYNFKKRSEQYNFRGENVITGCRSAFGCFIIWMTSTGHRQNMMSWGYLFTGVGFYKVTKINKTLRNGKVVRKTREVNTFGTQVFR